MESSTRSSSAPSSEQTASFYDQLVQGDVKRSLWGKEKRFDGVAIQQKSSVQKFYLPNVASYLGSEDRVLELGTGPGGFLAATASLCKEIVGADISQAFVDQCSATIEALSIGNATAVKVPTDKLQFEDASFDAVIMVDVIHHLADIEMTMSEVARVLKPGGRLLVFEPNKLNPALALMCALDRNEWGLLSLGTKSAYRDVLRQDFEIEEIDYNGLLVGPDSKFALSVADLLNSNAANPLLRWLLPKIFVSAKRLAIE